MLAMTRKILQWLHDNEAQLQDIDCADGCDHRDVKISVYRRPDVEAWWEERESDEFVELVTHHHLRTRVIDRCDVKTTL